MDTIQQIEALENRLIEAMKASDVETLDTLISDDLIFTGHYGDIFTKETDINAHREGNITIYDITATEQHIKPFGDVVIVSVKKEISGSFFGDTEVGLYRFTRVWKQIGAEWKIIAGHSTQIVR
jgi:ketosteroid isomerase-like protein